MIVKAVASPRGQGSATAKTNDGAEPASRMNMKFNYAPEGELDFKGKRRVRGRSRDQRYYIVSLVAIVIVWHLQI